MRHVRPFVVVTIVIFLCAFAVWRVRPYLHDRDAVAKGERRQIVHLLEHSVIPEYEESMVQDNVGLHDSLDRKIRAVFQSMPEHHRPGSSDAAAIAERYLNFLELNLTGTRADLLDQYETRGCKPYPWLVQQEDPTKPDKAWRASVAWARYAPFDVDSLQIETVQHNGVAVAEPKSIPAPIYSPNIESGTLHGLLSKVGQAYTAYEFQTTHTVPNNDGKSEFPVTICVMIANVGPRGAWDVVATTHAGIPDGTRVSLPYP